MVYKFVRTDLSEPYKVALPVGKHVIGRGKFLVDNVDDNKVSRNHAEMNVTADSVIVKSLHVNPCFFIRKSTKEIQVLSQNNTITLNNGDQFGILPQIYWYELIYSPEENNQDNESIKHVGNSTEAQVERSTAFNEPDVQVETCVDMNKANEQVETCVDMNKADEQVETCVDMNKAYEQVETCPNIDNIKKENVSINFDMNETAESRGSQESISVLRNQSPTQDYDLNSPLLAPSLDESDGIRTPVKRPHNSQESSENEELKKAKTESNDSNKAGPSKQEKVTPKKEVKDEPSQSPAQPPTVQLRERCMYGANCYRKNVQHKAQFSHPQDSDWDNNQRQCQFGAGCRRRDPRHWRDYQHPPGVNPPNPNRPGKRKQKKNSVSDSEDSSPSRLLMTGKRVRKTVRREEWNDSQSESEQDPYGSDDSEEWVPPSDVTETQDYTEGWD